MTVRGSHDPTSITGTDFIDVYEAAFARLIKPRLIVELGVFHGDSLAWLAERFPRAEVFGVDILPIQPDWPVSPRIHYLQADQGDRGAVADVFSGLPGSPDLILEDGSHIPRHQVNCLIEGFARLRPGGLYVLEDINTGHPMTEAFSHHSRSGDGQSPTALHVLLALRHLRDTKTALTPVQAARLSDDHFFGASEVQALFDTIANIQVHKRTLLPLRCYNCGGAAFDYIAWKCSCGVDLYHPTDSMTCLIWKSSGDTLTQTSLAGRLRGWVGRRGSAA